MGEKCFFLLRVGGGFYVSMEVFFFPSQFAAPGSQNGEKSSIFGAFPRLSGGVFFWGGGGGGGPRGSVVFCLFVILLCFLLFASLLSVLAPMVTVVQPNLERNWGWKIGGKRD